MTTLSQLFKQLSTLELDKNQLVLLKMLDRVPSEDEDLSQALETLQDAFFKVANAMIEVEDMMQPVFQMEQKKLKRQNKIQAIDLSITMLRQSNVGEEVIRQLEKAKNDA